MTTNNEDYDKAFTATMDSMMAAVKDALTEEEMARFGELNDEAKASFPDPGLKVGTKAPDFTLPNVLGSTVTLSDELKEGPVILIFYRGSWCPVCNMHLKAFNALGSTYKEKYNAQIIAISPQLTEVANKLVEDAELNFKVCNDMDDTVIKAYGLHFILHSELAEIYKKFNMQVSDDAGGRLSLPVPATFIIDRQGTIRATQADAVYANRMKPAEVTKGLELVKKDTTGAGCGCVVS